MTNLLLYAEARQTIAQLNSAAEAGHDNLWTGTYPYAYPDEVFEELARERGAGSSVLDNLLDELFQWPAQREPQLAVPG